MTGSHEVEGSTPFGSTTFQIYAVLVSMAVIAGLGGRSAGADPTPAAMRVVAAGIRAHGAGSPAVWVARSQAELDAAMLARVPGFVLPSTPANPAVRFGEEIVVGIHLGERPTGGYGIDLGSAVRSDKVLRIGIRETKPAPDAMTIQMLTNPWVIVAVAETAPVERVVVKDASDHELASVVLTPRAAN